MLQFPPKIKKTILGSFEFQNNNFVNATNFSLCAAVTSLNKIRQIVMKQFMKLKNAFWTKSFLQKP